MSTYQEVYFPDSADAKFQAFLKENGGFYVGMRPNPGVLSEQLFSIWYKESAPVRGLVSQMLSADSERSSLINQGVVTIVGETTGSKFQSDLDALNPDISWPEVRFGLYDIFTSELPEQPPTTYTVQRTSEGFRLARSSGNAHRGLSLKQITATIYRFGLSGEKPLSLEQVAKRVGIATPNVGREVYQAQRALAINKTFRRLVFRDPNRYPPHLQWGR